MADDALAFLYATYPEGPWALTSIKPDTKGNIETRTFYPKSEDACRSWLNKYIGSHNLYWHVNPVKAPVSKKALRTDIKSVNYFHVDVDPRAGEDLEEEKKRILTLFAEKLPKGVPSPSFVLNSGGGYQGFWKLKEPIEIDGDLEKAEDAKRYNIQLEVLFGADNCHNIDRLMRLPGTVNIPDKNKRKKGRTPCNAKIEFYFVELDYELDKFLKAPLLQPKQDKSVGSFTTDNKKIAPSNIKRIDDLEELNKWRVPGRVKVIINQGHHPEEEKEGDNSRSAWVFDVCCNLVRSGVPEDVIFAIITDPEFAISERILERKGGGEKYALRQIERAVEQAVDPLLREFNDKFAVIANMGGKCRVIEEVHDYALDRLRFTNQSFTDFGNRHMHIKINCGLDKKGNAIEVPAGKWWLNHIKRRQYNTIVFVPGKEVEGAYNLWKGFAVQSIPGDCNLFIDHVFKNMCKGDIELFTYAMGWLASCVQHPNRPGEVAMVLRGGKGVGKSFFAKMYGSLFGRHFMQISNSSHLVGNFNSHLQDVVVLFADEAFFAGDKKHASVLKTLITEETMAVEAKGLDTVSAPNFVHLIMASNDNHVIPASGDERRFFFLDVGEDNKQDSKYFSGIAEQMNNGGREALLHYLMNYDLSEFNVRLVPETEGLRQQKLYSMSDIEEWWYNKLQHKEKLPGEVWDEEVEVDAREMVDDYVEHVKRFNIARRSNEVSLGQFLKRVCPDISNKRRVDGTKRNRFYYLPSVNRARESWEKIFGKIKWDEVEEVQEEMHF